MTRLLAQCEADGLVRRRRDDHGRTAYTFTMFQAPRMPDELSDAQHASLRREFVTIEAAFA